MKINETFSMQEAFRALNKKIVEDVGEDCSNYAFALGGEFANGLGGDTIVYSDFKLTDAGWTYTDNVETFGPFETLFDCIRYQLDLGQTPEELQRENEISEIDDLRLWTFVSKSLAAQLSKSELAKIQQHMDAFNRLPSVEDSYFEIRDLKD